MSQAVICDSCGQVGKGEVRGWVHTEPLGPARYVAGAMATAPITHARHDFCSAVCVARWFAQADAVARAAYPGEANPYVTDSLRAQLRGEGPG